jgi:ribonuclease J
MDLQRFAELGREGVLALFGDSTNSETPGLSTSESVVKQGFADLLERTKGRVIVAQFSSNIDRVGGLIELAEEHNRKVVLLGRSLLRNYGLAKGQGFLDEPKGDVIIQPHEMDNYDEGELLVISTGSQAEPRASLTRMALGDHHMITVEPSDTVVISARQIPGNERGIQNMINNLAKRGATVLTASDGPIHCTGHAKAEELKLMINLTQPEHLVPVHGEFRMRKRHAELGRAVGVDNAQLITDGDVLEFRRDGANVIGRVSTGRQMVDSGQVGDIQDLELRDRAKLANSGIVVAFLVMDRDKGKVASGPELIQRGFMGEVEIDEHIEDAASYALQAVNDLSNNARRELNEVREAVRTSVRRYFRKQINRKPVVIPVVHEL